MTLPCCLHERFTTGRWHALPGVKTGGKWSTLYQPATQCGHQYGPDQGFLAGPHGHPYNETGISPDIRPKALNFPFSLPFL